MVGFDLIIPIAISDFEALKKSLPYIRKHIRCSKIIVIANKQIESKVLSLGDISFLDENGVFEGMDLVTIKNLLKMRSPKSVRRAGWYFQQFIKMGYAKKTNSSYYMSWDSDTIPLTDLSFFEGERPILHYINAKTYDDEYFYTIRRMFKGIEIPKKRERSYITEHMMFSKKIMMELIDKLSFDDETFYSYILKSINASALNLSGFSEFETYAAYVRMYHYSDYVEKPWNNLRNARFYIDNPEREELNQWIAKSFEVVSFEDYDRQSLINKLAILFNIHKWVTFNSWYKLIQPIYELYYDIRMKIRQLIKR